MDSTQDLLAAFACQLGILAIVVVGVAATRPRADGFTGLRHQGVAGLVFGAAAVLAMLNPTEVQPGVFVDVRSVVVAVAGPFGGPVAASIAVVLAGAYRVWLGGGAMLVGLTALVGCALVGVAFGELVRRGRIALSVRSFVGLSLVATFVNLVSLTVLPGDSTSQALMTAVVPLALSNLVGIPLLGTFLLAKMQQRILRQELSTALAVQSEQLRVSEARHRIIATNTADLITRLDPSLRRIDVSPSVCEILGYEPEELLGRTPDDLAHPDDAAQLLRNLTAMSNGSMERHSGIHRMRHKDGRWIWMESNSRAVLSSAPGRYEIVAVVRDISARLELEEQVRQAQKVQALGQLTGGIAHDFNNILTVILGDAEVLVSELKNPEHRGLALEIETAAEQAAALTGKLLAYGRRHALLPEVADLTLVAQDMTAILPRLLGGAVEMRTAFDGPCLALFDVTLMQSAILNLAINARDALPNGGWLSIRTGRRIAGKEEGDIPEGAEVVVVTVEDNGTGMPPEVLKHVFEPFFTTKEVGKGSGLGLSMVYGFAKQSGGHVAIESRAGEGTTVSIILLAAKARDAAAGDAEP